MLPDAMRVVPVVCACLVLLSVVGAQAQLDDDRLRLFRESVSYTDVIDAVDDQDRFDLNVNLGFTRVRDRAAIYRERTRADGSVGPVKVAESTRDVSELSLGFDFGLYRDLMASARLPLVLSDARSLRAPSGRSAEAVQGDLSDVGAPGDPAEPLFQLPFYAPTRAGLDYLAFGGAWAVTNQMREPWLPTWVLRIEGRRALGRPLYACRDAQAGPICGTQSGEDRDGDGASDGTRRAGQRPGSSRGVSALLAETRFSRRYRSAEPYAGLAFLVEWPARGKQVFQSARGAGLPRARPGTQSTATLGVALIPWENRGSQQRLALDLRLAGSYVSAGSEYSALYDALGSSGHPELARKRYEGVRGSAPARGIAPCRSESDVDCGIGRAATFDGLTEVGAHLRYGGQLGLEVQAARYVRFGVGTSLTWVSAHALTGRAACDGASSGSAFGDDGRVCAAGAVDPRQRDLIDAPGRRFLVRDELLLGAYAQATAMF